MSLNARAWVAGFAVNAARIIEHRQRKPDFFDLGEAELAANEADIAYQRDVIADVERVLPDDELLKAYQQTDGDPDNWVARDLLAEIQRRNLDV